MAETDALAKMREEFKPNQISKLPKETKAQVTARNGNNSLTLWNCPVCGGHHHKDAKHLDYVGHAALTDRLLDADIAWSWEPLALDAHGLPALDRFDGLWIKLTIGGVTRLGYGSADGKTGGNAIKELIGDALRNAAMRFGAALDLWHKGELHVEEEEDASNPQGASNVKPIAKITKDQAAELMSLIEATGADIIEFCRYYKANSVAELDAAKFEHASKALKSKLPVEQAS